MIKCEYFNKCSAPLCPKIKDTIKKGIWYKGEEVCKIKNFQSKRWIKAQRKINRLRRPIEGFFTVDMLKLIHKIPDLTKLRGIQNLNKKTIQKWLEEYKLK